jgi:hypothetical protein
MENTQVDFSAILKRLDELEAREQIRGVIARYSRAVDRTDPSVARQALWPDARFPFGPPQGAAEEFIDPLFGDYIEKVLAATHHMMGNTIIDLQGDVAFTETYAVAHHRSHPTPEGNAAMLGAQNLHPENSHKELELIIGLRYLDRLEKRDGVWKIVNRRLVFDWSQQGVYSGIEAGGLYEGTPLRGSRKDTDPSFRR